MLVQTYDVETLLLRNLTEDEEQWFERLAELAQGALEGMLPGFAITAGDETVDVRAHGGDLWTPKYPVTAVASVAAGAAALSANSYEFTEHGHVTFGVRTVLNEFEINMADDWPTDNVYTINYSYGFDTVPDSVVLAGAGALARAYRTGAAGGAGVTQETLGSYSVTYEQTAATLLSIVDDELRPLRKWRRNRQVSVPLIRAR